MLALTETCAMSGEDVGKRSIKINDFKVPIDWHLMVKSAAREDHRKISEEIIHLVYLGLRVRKRIQDIEDSIIDDVSSGHLANGPPTQKKRGSG